MLYIFFSNIRSFILINLYRFEGFKPLTDEEPPLDLPGEPVGNMTVGEYALVTEVSGRKNKKKVIYFVVHLLEQNEDLFKCDWYELDKKKTDFKKLRAQWEVPKERFVRKIAAPIEYGRRKHVMFSDVYLFLTGKVFEPDTKST